MRASTAKIQSPPPRNGKAPRRYGTMKDPIAVNEFVRRAMEGDPIRDCPNDQMPHVLSELVSSRDANMESNQLRESAIIGCTINRLRESMQRTMKDNIKKERQGGFRRRLGDAKRGYMQLVQQIERQEVGMQQRFERERQELSDRQEKDVMSLTDEWDSIEKTRRYNRTSQALRDLRIQVVKLMNAHRYDEVHIVEKRANDLEAQEAADMQRRMTVDFERALLVLEKKHDAEVVVLQKAQDSRAKEYEGAKVFDLRVARRRIEKLENEIRGSADSDRVWNLYYRNKRGLELPGTRKSLGDNREPVTLALPPLEMQRGKQDPNEMLSTTRGTMSATPARAKTAR